MSRSKQAGIEEEQRGGDHSMFQLLYHGMLQLLQLSRLCGESSLGAM